MPEVLAVGEYSSQRLTPASRPGRPGSGYRPGVTYSCYPSPSRYFPPLLREGLRRKESRRVWVTNNGPAIFLTPEVAWERLIDDEGYTVLVADREPHARGYTWP